MCCYCSVDTKLIYRNNRAKNHFRKITVQSRMMISTNPSSKLTTSRCLVAIVMTKMNASWKKDSIAILCKLQVDNRILQRIQIVDQAVVRLVALVR